MRLVAVFLSVANLACLTSEPSTSPMDIRAGDTGTLSGQVRVSTAAVMVRVPMGGWSWATPVPGATVELGRWRGNAVDFHDVVTRRSADDPRFHVLVGAVVDDTGAFRLDGLPKQTIFALRARPPAGATYTVTYVDSLFTVGNMPYARILFQANPSP
jgi:hypothetical protein